MNDDNTYYNNLIDGICRSLQDPVFSLILLRKNADSKYPFIEPFIGHLNLDNFCDVPKIGIGIFLSELSKNAFNYIDEARENLFNKDSDNMLLRDTVREYITNSIGLFNNFSETSRKIISILLEKIESYKKKEIEFVEENIPDIFYENINNINFCLLEVLDCIENHSDNLKDLHNLSKNFFNLSNISENINNDIKKDIDELDDLLNE